MGFLAKLLLGNGTLHPALRSELEAEGLVLVAEGVPGSLRYSHFKAPGKRFHGKVTAVRVGVGLSRERVVVYGHSGRAKLVDTPYSSPRWSMVEVAAEEDRVEFRVDYDKQEDPRFGGRLTILVKTPEANRIAGEVNARIATARREAASGSDETEDAAR
jgi:hypothetical protein